MLVRLAFINVHVATSPTCEDNSQPLPPDVFPGAIQKSANCVVKLVKSCVSEGTTFLCLECASLDSLRPPIKIPNQLSPKASIPFSVAFRSFTISLKSGKWDMIPVWKFFFDKQVQKNPAKVPDIFHPCKISVDKHIRKQCFVVLDLLVLLLMF
ncbi:hypothetical protein GEMRC1_009828 [Eukaryota sp. GEM-RC1]